MAKKEEKKTNTLKFVEVLGLSNLLNNCTNIPFKNVSAFLQYIELRESLSVLAKDYQSKLESIAETYKVSKVENTDGTGYYDIQNSENSADVLKALSALQNEDKEIKHLRSLEIEPLEIYQLASGLNNRDVDFIKECLLKKG